MFNGLIRQLGKITQMICLDSHRQFFIQADTAFVDGLEVGDSVAVNGCCLSVVAKQPGSFSVDVSPETLSVTTLGLWQSDMTVHLETGLRMGDKIDGHLVTGHIDAVATLVNIMLDEKGTAATFEYPSKFAPYIATKGSIAIDGVSLTVNHTKPGQFSVYWIPITLDKTAFGTYQVGHTVNIEIDMMARYLVHYAQQQQESLHVL